MLCSRSSRATVSSSSFTRWGQSLDLQPEFAWGSGGHSGNCPAQELTQVPQVDPPGGHLGCWTGDELTGETGSL